MTEQLLTTHRNLYVGTHEVLFAKAPLTSLSDIVGSPSSNARGKSSPFWNRLTTAATDNQGWIGEISGLLQVCWSSLSVWKYWQKKENPNCQCQSPAQHLSGKEHVRRFSSANCETPVPHFVEEVSYGASRKACLVVYNSGNLWTEYRVTRPVNWATSRPTLQYANMDVTVDLISAKKIKVFVDASDTTLDLKRKIAEETGIQPKRQVLRFPNTGELLPEAACVFDTLKSKGCRKVTVEYSRVKKSKDFFLDTVTCTGRVFRLVLPKGKLSTVKYVKGEISRLIKVPEEHIFLRVVNTAQYLSIPLGEEYKTLEECAVPEGAVLYVQIHPYLQL